LQEAARVALQSFKFTAAQAGIQFLSSSLQQSVNWAKDLNEVLTQISIVTGQNAT